MLDTLIDIAPLLFGYSVAAVIFCVAVDWVTTIRADQPSILLGDDNEGL